ncbi:MAG: hypothetical protein OXH03_07325, partial [Bacteroidetes bacterium]|nr:hypothetical protein [Bacteroidota bacterium]MDE2670904.1 hypothetical protein [Bacteroidota bacterium]
IGPGKLRILYIATRDKLGLSGSLECNPVGAMSESMLRVFNLSVARWWALNDYCASGIANKY